MSISAQKSQNVVTKENSLKQSEQSVTGFSDQRPDFKKVPEWTHVDPGSGNKFASVSDWDT